MNTIKVLGTSYRVATTELTRREIENAGAMQLARWIDYAGFELELAERRGAFEIADEIAEVIKQMRAQQAINTASASIANGCLCGLI